MKKVILMSIDKNELRNLYIEENKSRKQIAVKFGLSESSIKFYLKKFGIIKQKIKLEKRECKACGKLFRVNSRHKHFCSLNCMRTWQKNHKLKEKQCVICGKKFYVSRDSYKKKCCSSTCSVILRRQTNLERYGVEACTQREEIKNKIMKTNLNKYGSICSLHGEDIEKKVKSTLIERYGVENPMQAKQIKEKVKETSIARYGTEHPFQNKEIRLKYEETMNKKYGVEHPSKSKEILQKKVDNNVKKWKVPYPITSSVVQEKIDETKRKNHSYNTSKPEEIIHKLLVKLYKDVKRQYKSKLYPFHCDFYIPILDLYIEYQGYPTHGGEPFDPTNKQHINKLKSWIKKSEEINLRGNKKDQYSKYVEVWTKKDPEKREIARKNKLNWIEFFSLEDFNNWFMLQEKSYVLNN